MNLAAVDLNLLKALAALIDEANVTRAANKLGWPRPAMSRALHRLRDLIHDPILWRTQHGMVLTPRARSLALPLRRMLDQIRDMLEPGQPFDPKAATETFTLSLPDAGQILVAPALLRHLKREAPQVRINTIYRFAGNAQYGALESGEVDVGIEASRKLPTGFHAAHLFDADYRCIARTDHPSIGKRLTLKTFLELGHIALRIESTSAEPDIDDVLAKQSRTRRVVLSVPSYLPVPWLIANSDLIATVPRPLVDMIVGRFAVKGHNLPVPIKPLPVSIIWHDRTHDDPKQQWLRKTVLELFRAPGSARPI